MAINYSQKQTGMLSVQLQIMLIFCHSGFQVQLIEKKNSILTLNWHFLQCYMIFTKYILLNFVFFIIKGCRILSCIFVSLKAFLNQFETGLNQTQNCCTNQNLASYEPTSLRSDQSDLSFVSWCSCDLIFDFFL